MSGHSTYQPQNGFMRWLEARLAWLPLGGQYVIDAMRT